MGVKFNPFTGNLDLIDTTAAAGADTQVQFNNGGNLSGSADLTWDNTGKELGVGGDINLASGGTYTTTLQTITPTANRTISFPNATGTVSLVAGSSGQLVYNNAGAYAGASNTSVGASGDITLSLNGAASTPPVSLTGTWFTGGTSTTTTPQFLIEPAGTTSTTWNINGTGFGVNAASGFAGNLLDLQVNGSSKLYANKDGNIAVSAGSQSAPSLTFTGDTNTGIYSPGADQVAISTNGAGRLFVDAGGAVSIGDTWANNSNPVVYVTKNSDVGNIVLKGNGGTSNALAVYSGGWSGSDQVFGVRGDGSLWGYTDLIFGTGSTYSESMRLDSSGRLLVGTPTATGAATLQVQTPTTLAANGDTGISFTNLSTKTYPTIAGGYSVYPGYYQDIEVGTDQVVNTNYNYVYCGYYSRLRKSNGNTQDIERLYLNGFTQLFNWGDGNTCKQYIGFKEAFSYAGYNANGRTTAYIRSNTVNLYPPDGTNQTIATLIGKEDITYWPGSATIVNVTDSANVYPGLYFRNYSPGTHTVNITHHAFFSTDSYWGLQGGFGTFNATITNLYGLRLTAPIGSFTVTNNWGIRQEWSSAKNWFAGVVNQFPNITTTASGANAFLDSVDSNRLYRSTSSIVYKKDVEDLDHTLADNIHLLRPVWYRSKCEADCQDWSWFGLIAEEVAEIEPRLVHFGYQEDAYELVDVTETIELSPEDPRRELGHETEEITRQERRLKADAQQVPNGVAYDRLSVLLLDVIQRQETKIKNLEARLTAAGI